MRIVEEARSRSAGAPAAVPPAGRAKSALARVARDAGPAPAVPPGARLPAEAPKTPLKTIGSFFDAYA